MHATTRHSLLLVLLLAPAPARAWDFSLLDRDFTLDVTNTFLYTYRASDAYNRAPTQPRPKLWDPEDKHHQVLNTLDVSLSHDVFRLGGRFDLNLFADSPVNDLCPGLSWCGQRYENHFAAERLYLIVARPEFDLTMGDFYASFGRGMALNVVKIDELGQDTTIRGGKMVYHDHGLGVTFLAGEFNPLDLDTSTGYRAPWPAEPVVAGRVEYNFFETVIAGAHGVFIVHDDPDSSGVPVARTNHDVVWGAGLEVPSLLDGALSLVGEFDLQRTVQDGSVFRGPGKDGDDPDGIAAYTSATAQLGDFTFLGEYKYYDNYVLQARGGVTPYPLLYHHPPTLERITADLKDNTSVSGGRLRVDYNLGELGPLELLLFVNYGYFQDWHGGNDHRIHNPFGGFELMWMDGEGKAQVEGGLRRTYDAEGSRVAYRDIHFELDVEQPLASHHSIKLSYVLLHRLEYDSLSGDREWDEMDLALSYKWSPHLSVAVTFESQGDPRVVGPETETYLGGFVRYYITPSSYVNLRVGENRPGIKCYLGTCRYVPAFSGVELQGVLRF